MDAIFRALKRNTKPQHSPDGNDILFARMQKPKPHKPKVLTQKDIVDSRLDTSFDGPHVLLLKIIKMYRRTKMATNLGQILS